MDAPSITALGDLWLLWLQSHGSNLFFLSCSLGRHEVPQRWAGTPQNSQVEPNICTMGLGTCRQWYWEQRKALGWPYACIPKHLSPCCFTQMTVVVGRVIMSPPWCLILMEVSFLAQEHECDSSHGEQL